MNYAEYKAAHIYLRDDLAGKLEKLSADSFAFTYDDGWMAKAQGPVAFSLPLFQKAHQVNQLFPFFDNLIPEGWLLDYVRGAYKIDKDDRFALLLATCHFESIGAVRVVALDSEEQEISLSESSDSNDKECPLEMLAPKEKALQKKLWDTTKKITVLLDPDEPLNSFRKTVRGCSISGAQSKGLFYLDSEGKFTPSRSASQFIVKPLSNVFAELPENEYITMEIAKKVGFEVPPCALVDIEGVGRSLVIKRFDVSKEGRRRCEDFAQILNENSEGKFKLSYEKVAKAIDKYSHAPVADLYEFYRRLIFSFFIGNGDMHLKNWSLLEVEPGANVFYLSPCYDLLNTRLAIADENEEMALTIDGKKNKITRQTFIQFAGQFLGNHLVEKPFGDLALWWEVTEKCVQYCALSDKYKEEYLEIVKNRYRRLKVNT